MKVFVFTMTKVLLPDGANSVKMCFNERARKALDFVKNILRRWKVEIWCQRILQTISNDVVLNAATDGLVS